MSDEIKVAKEEKEHKCLCQNENFRKFVVITAGSFTGVFLALSLFAALHKPPVFIQPSPFMHHRQCPIQMMRDFNKQDGFNRDDFNKHFDKKAPANFKDNAPFDAQRHHEND